jgi:hypothetical protein
MAELGVGLQPNVACEFKRAGFPEGGMTAKRTLRILELAARQVTNFLRSPAEIQELLSGFAAASHCSADSRSSRPV